MIRNDHNRAIACGERRGFAFNIAIHTNNCLLAALNGFEAARVGFHKPRLHVTVFNSRNCATLFFDLGKFGTRLGFQLFDLARDLVAAIEEIAIFEKICFIGHDLLDAQRPLLIKRTRQAKRLIPCRQLHRARAGIFG